MGSEDKRDTSPGALLAPSLWQRMWREGSPPEPGYWLTRFFILRLLGLIYFVGFVAILDQGGPLLGADGLLPAADHLDRLAEYHGSRWQGFVESPSLFWLDASDTSLMALAWLGAALSVAVLLGYCNALMLFALWLAYISYVNVGQLWYAFGWEIQLLETGFLAVFLCPLLDLRPFPGRPPPRPVIWLYRWLIFRIMLGAGLIKLRGDACWTELTCLSHHFETQPVPNPASALLHHAPSWVHGSGVMFNHVCEVVAPFFVFGPRIARHVAGLLMLVFQLMLIASGNLSFLNWLTIVPIIACFDDGWLVRLVPGRWRAGLDQCRRGATVGRGQKFAVSALFIVVAWSSVDPVLNLMSEGQKMNTSFDRLYLVNTYGAFGSVGRERLEIEYQGTSDDPAHPDARWRAYEFPCKPGDVDRRPCLISPYHHRLDWLLWFAAMGTPDRYPFTVHLVWKMLQDDASVDPLIAHDPFPDAPPRAVRVVLYRYEFAPLGADGWWRRQALGLWIPPLTRDDPRLRGFVRAHGWLRE